MNILGLHGLPGSGKDTIADHLVERYGFIKFAFSDALYAEVQQAYRLEDQSLLRDRATKEVPTGMLALGRCIDQDFTDRVFSEQFVLSWSTRISPRQVLQWWGTEYRRAQNTRYWLERVEDFILACRRAVPYPEFAPNHFVECGTRFPNEQGWIHEHEGNVWHIHRAGIDEGGAHSSDIPLPLLPGERQLWNNGTLDQLGRGVDLLMRTSAEFVRVEPLYKGPWCCEKAQVLQVPVCPDCAETSAGYSAAMSPEVKE